MQTATSVITLRLHSAQYPVTPGLDLHRTQPFDLGQTVEASVGRDEPDDVGKVEAELAAFENH